MARTRYIKPGFFQHEKLGSLPAHCRLLFIGLWTIADREGRLLYRPKQIKAAVLPYDRVNVSQLLDRLQSEGFLRIYEAGDCKYIEIVNWDKHQKPHIKEAASTYPAPTQHRTSTYPAPDEQPLQSLIPLNDISGTAAPDFQSEEDLAEATAGNNGSGDSSDPEVVAEWMEKMRKIVKPEPRGQPGEEPERVGDLF